MSRRIGVFASRLREARGTSIARAASCFAALALALAAMLGAVPAAAQSGSTTVTITLNIAVAATVDVAKVKAATTGAIGTMLSHRANVITTSGPDTTRMHARLAGGTLFGGVEESSETGGSASRAGTKPDSAPLAMSRTGDRISGFGGAGAREALWSGDDRIRSIGVFDERTSGFGGAIQRLDGMPDRRTITNPIRFGGDLENGAGRFAFSTSLAEWRAAAEALEQVRRVDAGLAPSAPLSGDRIQTGLRSIDLWVEATSSYFTNSRIDGRFRGQATVAHAGIDMAVLPGLLVGVMGSYDRIGQTSSTIGQNGDGRGWTAGPYLSARLTRSLYFDLRYNWGQSTNSINPLGAFVDRFSTTRQLVSTKLTGDLNWDAVRFRPSAEVVWFSEKSKDYANAIGIGIPGQTVSLGRAMFGPEVGYKLALSDKSVLEPYIGIKGVWNFAQTQQVNAAGAPVSGERLGGRVELGLSYRAPNGMTVRGFGAYDGIGASGYSALLGRFGLSVPLP